MMYAEDETFDTSASPSLPEQPQKANSSPRSSRFGRRFFRSRKSRKSVDNSSADEHLDSTENSAENYSDKRENSPTLQLTTSNSRDSVTSATSSRSKKSMRNPIKTLVAPLVAPPTRKILEQPPPAREAAFGGPPRYDWIDIETAAAIRVQAAYRRNKTMRDLEQQGITTVAIRNRARTRAHPQNADDTDFPGGIFGCCGIGFSFCDEFTQDDYAAQKDYQKHMYEEKKKSKLEREEQLRHDYSKKLQVKQQQMPQNQEVYEVVEE